MQYAKSECIHRGGDIIPESTKNDSLVVRMLGGFSLLYHGKAVSFGRKRAAKSLQLLQLVLLHLRDGVTKSRLIEALYGRDDVENENSSLNNTLFRLRRQLETAGLPEDEYIIIQGGMCTWSSKIPVVMDIYQFLDLIDSAEKSLSKSEKIEFLKQACQMYRGEFLPDMLGEEWVSVANVYFQDKYFVCLKEVCELLKDERDYNTILELASNAAQIYPYEEWQIWKIDALIALNRYREAMDTYQEVNRIAFEEFGLSPSKQMLDRFKVMSSNIQQSFGSMEDIKAGLEEEAYGKGAYYCPLPSFIDSYRIIARMMERNGIAAYMILCTLKDSSGIPLENSIKLKSIAIKFERAVKASLRRGDLFTRYSPTQYLILLGGATLEGCSVVQKRINANFKEHGGGRNQISYNVTPLSEDFPVNAAQNQSLSFSDCGWT